MPTILDDTFAANRTLPTTVGGAGNTNVGPVGLFNDAWTDVAGGWRVDAGGVLGITVSDFAASHWLLRPANEACSNQRVTAYFTLDGTTEMGLVVRASIVGGVYSAYRARFTPTTCEVYRITGNGQGQTGITITSGGGSPSQAHGLASGTAYVAAFSASGTAITLTVATQAAPGTPVFTMTGTDTIVTSGVGALGSLFAIAGGVRVTRVVYECTDAPVDLASSGAPAIVSDGTTYTVDATGLIVGNHLPIKATWYEQPSLPLPTQTTDPAANPVGTGFVLTRPNPTTGPVYLCARVTDASGAQIGFPWAQPAALTALPIYWLTVRPHGGKLVVACIGDSITAESSYAGYLEEELVAYYPDRAIIAIDLGVSGSGLTVANPDGLRWIRGQAPYTSALAAIADAFATHGRVDLVDCMLGTNDVQQSQTPAAIIAAYEVFLADFRADLAAIDARIAPPIVCHDIPQNAIIYFLGPSYTFAADVMDHLPYDATVRRGSRLIPSYFGDHPEQMLDAVHPTLTDGAQALARLRADGIYHATTGAVPLPVVGDVESGVAYGDAPALTGTFAVPAAEDVLLGVGYGAGGTEFMGAADPLPPLVPATFHVPENDALTVAASARTAGDPDLVLADGSAFGDPDDATQWPKVATVTRGVPGEDTLVCRLEIAGRSGATLAVAGAVEGPDADILAGDHVFLAPTKLAMTEVHAAIHADELAIAANINSIAAKAPLASPTFTGMATIPAHVSPTTVENSGAFNLAASDWHSRTLDGTNGTLSLASPAVDQQFTVVLRQGPSGGPYTVTWFAGILWSGGVAPTLTTTANKRDVFTFKCESAGVYLGFVAGQGM
jgi:hypothetical protein